MISSPTVSAIVPARNEEATIAAAVASLASQPEIREILVVNDQSTDGTAAILEQLSRQYAQLQVLATGQLPEGWTGKNFAVSLGAAKATGEWLLLTDADGLHLPGSAARALVEAEANGAGILSYSPEQEMRTWWEKALIPFVYNRLGRKFAYDLINDPASSVAAASGIYILIRRKDYERIGGHAAIAGEVLEDVALARNAKSAGLRLRFGPGTGIIRVRMYRTFGAMWRGWTKNLYPLMGGTHGAVTREVFAVVPWISLGLFLLIPVHRAFGVFGAAFLAARHAVYAAELRRNRFSASAILYYILAVSFYVGALLTSERKYRRGRIEWKGREYPAGPPGS
jgi:glycosyltransferase involved in cell wall biosynthesis